MDKGQMQLVSRDLALGSLSVEIGLSLQMDFFKHLSGNFLVQYSDEV